MKKKNYRNLYISVSMLIAFVLWTLAVRLFDVKAIGPAGSVVGLATINGFIHKLTGVHMSVYHITDWLGLVPIFTALGFFFLGLTQWFKRKRLDKVDYSVLILGGFYAVVFVLYVLFEMITVNYRPVLIEGLLEKSYPSSTTMLVICVMTTAIMQINRLIKSKIFKKCASILIVVFIIFMILGRLISGVHWFTDIVGGALLSAGLVMLYRYFVCLKK